MSATVNRVIVPPNRAEGTGPSSRAATPLSKYPSSFELPTKIALTYDTRPSISGGTFT